MKSLVAFVIGCVFAATFAFGETLTVTSNADSGDGTLRALLAASAADDEIVIPANMTITLESVLTLPKWNLTIRGNGKTSIVSGNNAVPIFEINNKDGSDVRYEIKDLVMEKGFLAAGSAGIKLTNPIFVSLVMNDCIVRDMSVTPLTKDYQSIGVFMNGGKNTFDFFATNTVFTGLWGGSAVGRINYRTFEMSQCRIVDNGDLEQNHPAYSLLYLNSNNTTPALIDKCVIANNASSNTIGIAYCEGSSAAHVLYHFRDCVITNNLAGNGWGMFDLGVGRHVFENCVISDNTAAHNVLANASFGGYGVELRNCVIERNRTTATTLQWNDTGLVYSRSKVVDAYSEVLLVSNCVVRGNYSRGNSLFYSKDSAGVLRFVDTLIEDNEIWGSNGIIDGDKTNVLTRCAILNNRQDTTTTAKGGYGIVKSNAKNCLDSCLFMGNAFCNCRYIISTLSDITGCSFVSNLTSAIQENYPALNLTADSVVLNTIALGSLRVTDGSTVTYDASWNKSYVPAMTNCYFQKATAAIADQGIVTGKTASDLMLDCTLTTDGSKTVFLDGTRMPYLAFTKGSLLRDAGVAHALLGPKDIRGKRRDSKPDIGAYEGDVGLTVIYR